MQLPYGGLETGKFQEVRWLLALYHCLPTLQTRGLNLVLGEVRAMFGIRKNETQRIQG
jgi:hypothetical protein